MSKSDFFPSLPLRDIVVFPGMIVPLFVGRDRSIKALNEVMKTNKKIILVTQKNAEVDNPIEKDLYSFGCEGKVLQLLKLPDGTIKVLVEGLDRVKIKEYKNEKDYYNMWKDSLFGISYVHGGWWEALRYYEMLMNGCIPIILNLEKHIIFLNEVKR